MDARPGAKPATSGRRRGRLVRRYVVISVVLVSGGLIASGLVEIYFRYREGWRQAGALQHEVTAGAAFKVERFIHGIEHDLRAASRNREITAQGLTRAYRFELRRLLSIAPAVTEAMAIDLDGVTRAMASRFGTTLPIDKGVDTSSDALAQTRRGQTYFGPVYFFRGTEPYMAIAVPVERFAGEVIGLLRAEVNLKYVWEVVADLEIGRGGYAYVVTRHGDLVAHPDITRVLQPRNIVGLAQVEAAFSARRPPAPALVAWNLDGRRVLSSSALVHGLGWAVLVERPLEEVYGPLYDSILRTSALLLAGLGMALLAGLFMAGRVVRPLEALEEGVGRIGRGDLASRLDLKTGDEIETLAEEFNSMAAALQTAHGGLEQNVRERTEELRAANRKLTELDRLKSDFVSNVSHELRTPLTAVKGATDNLLDGLAGALSDKQTRYLERIKTNTERLARLIGDLLDLSRIEAGKLEARPTRVALADLTKEVIETLRPVAGDKEIHLAVQSAGGAVAAWANRDRVAQVLMNLVGNALKFTPRGGRITVAFRRTEDGWAEISIVDTGPGIPPDEADRIFDRFYQIARGDGAKAPGTGLGLAISRALVEMHGGRIWVESATGGGSTFRLTLPAEPRAGTGP